MTTTFEVREAMAEAITDGTGLRASSLFTDTVNAPIAIVMRQEFDPRFVFSGVKSVYQYQVTIYVDRVNERAGQIALDEYVETTGAASVIAAIQDEDNWPADLIDYAQVTNVSAVSAVAVNESQYLAVALDVEVCF